MKLSAFCSLPSALCSLEDSKKIGVINTAPVIFGRLSLLESAEAVQNYASDVNDTANSSNGTLVF